MGPEDWFAAEVGAVARAGLVGGYEDGTFRPHRVVTREQAVAIVARAWRRRDPAGAVPDAGQARALLAAYADAAAVADWAAGEWALAVREGLIKGLPGGPGVLRLAPGEPLTRAQAAALLARLWRRL